MSTSVKHIHSGMRGAPVINNTAGTLIAALDAFFLTGWGITTALSVTVASGIATASITPGETFDRDAVILVEGATPAEINGEARVITTSNSEITWATTAADGVATGSITIKYAPQAGWSKVYAGTNKAVYRSNHVQSAGHYLRVDDTDLMFSRVRGYESMSDVDTGDGPFPTDAQMSGGAYWWKSVAAGAGGVIYRIFADERTVLAAISVASVYNVTNLAAPLRGFGDPIALSPSGDAWASFLSGNGDAWTTATRGALDSQVSSNVSGLCCMARAISGLGNSVLVNTRAFSGVEEMLSGADSWLGTLPSDVDGQIKTARIMLRETAAVNGPRAVVPGVYYVPQNGAIDLLGDGDMLDGAGDLSGRRLMVIHTGTSYTSPATGAYLVDISGPWR